MRYKYTKPYWCKPDSEKDREIGFLLTNLSNLFEAKNNVNLLDVGFAGAGYIENILDFKNINYIGLDRNHDRIQGDALHIPNKSETGFSREKWRNILSKITSVKSDITNYKSSILYDIIISISTIEHIVPMGYGAEHGFDYYKDVQAVNCMKKLVKEGEYLLLTFPCGKECIFSSKKDLKNKLPGPLKNKFIESRHDILIYDKNRIDKIIGDWKIVEEQYWIKPGKEFTKSKKDIACNVQYQSSDKDVKSLCTLLLKNEKNYCMPLFSGIGNIIQGLPFAFEMRRRYGKIDAFVKDISFPQSMNLLKGIFAHLYPRKLAVPTNYKKFKVPVRRHFSEYKSWFVDNNERLPTEFKIDFINYEKVLMKHKIVLWAEGQKNWPCKRWPYWEQLASKLKDVAVVGLEKADGFKNIADYRGKLSLLQVGGLIRNADIFIGNEGGISHYAAALGTKTYIIYGCTDPTKNMPPKNAIRISKNLPCQPCQFRNMVQKGVNFGCENLKCLKELTVEDVLKEIKKCQ